MLIRFIYVATVMIQLLPVISFAQTNHHTSSIPTDTIKEGITRFFKLQASVRYIYTAAIHPAGIAVAWCADKDVGQRISLAFVAHPHNIIDISAATGNEESNE